MLLYFSQVVQTAVLLSVAKKSVASLFSSWKPKGNVLHCLESFNKL